MPIFDYCCKNCGHEIEVLLKPGESAPVTCEKCQKETLAQKVSAPSFRLGGGGWYETIEKPKDKQRNILQSDNSASGTDTKKAS